MKTNSTSSNWAAIKVGFVGTLVGLCIGFGIGLHNYIDANKRLQRNCDYYGSTYLRKQGGTRLWSGSNGEWLNYDLRSFDGGKNWYAISIPLMMVFLFLAKRMNVYPGLMKQKAGWDALFDFVRTNGPINNLNEKPTS